MGRAAGQRADRPALEPLAPALLVRGAAEAAAALRLAEGRRLTLLSAPGAAEWLGAEAWRALVAEAAKLAPGAPFADLLCCADAPGRALAALRAGCRRLVLDGACPAFAQVEAAAAALGAVLLPARPPALDLAGLDLRKPGGALLLRRWLDTDDSVARSGAPWSRFTPPGVAAPGRSALDRCPSPRGSDDAPDAEGPGDPVLV